MARRTVDFLIALIALICLATLLPGQASAATMRPIQGQGASSYCLFAVNANLAGGDLWGLADEYRRRGLPTWDGQTPYNENVLALSTELYGAQWHIWGEGDWWEARWGVEQGYPTAYTGLGHAIVVVDFVDGNVHYLDSLHPESVQVMSEAALQSWWDGWAWYNKSYNLSY
jgi:hypothetical protein